MKIKNTLRPAKGSKTDALFKSMKKDTSYVVGPLDKYLTDMSASDSDRAINVNAPSAIGSCPRAIWYARSGVDPDSNFIEPRTRRIFDNGHHMHERLQCYLKDAGILLMDEVPIRSDEYNIQGHTDGIILLEESTRELGVLELKSINDGNFKDLVDAKHDHKQQGLIYSYCLEERRRYLHNTYKGKGDIFKFYREHAHRDKYYASLYDYLVDGRKFSREEKLEYKIVQHSKVDLVLLKCTLPVTKAVIVYENKNDQSLKEYVVDSTTQDHQKIIRDLLLQCKNINEAVEEGQAPAREGHNKSDGVCRWCNWKLHCWL